MAADTIPKGAWSIGVGLLLLGLNATRYMNKIRMSGFITFLGLLALVGGVGDMLGRADLNGAFILIILGAYLILKPCFEERRLFGKAEHKGFVTAYADHPLITSIADSFMDIPNRRKDDKKNL